MAEKQLNKELQSEMDTSVNDVIGIDLLGILDKVVAIRKTLYKAAGVGLILGVVVALSIPKHFQPEIRNHGEEIIFNLLKWEIPKVIMA